MENNQDKGFTLVELLIVIVILGILATVTVFAVRGITDKGQENACSVEQRTLDTAIEAFYAQNQEDPAQVVTNVAANGDSNDLLGLSPEYLKDAPDEDKFVFTAAGSGSDQVGEVGDSNYAAAVPAGQASFAVVDDGPCDTTD
jgi:prepilin-type N-terminal cleavage/methylation domain-containing protein|tara:strand:- start:1452 stop:1880 length:429 start_codon:yes stop_codon:yes gene_type:complete